MRRFALRSIVIAACSFLVADTIAAYLEQALTPPALQTSLPTGSSNAPRVSIDMASLSQEIAQSELFPPLPAGVSAGGYGRTSPPPPLDAAKKIKLMGTVMGEGLSALAVVQNLSTQRQVLYHLHEQIPDLGEISEVHADGILIRNGAQEELLALAGLKLPITFAPPPPSTPRTVANQDIGRTPNQPLLALPPPLHQADGNAVRMVLDRREIAPHADSFTHERNARFEPASTDGKPEGWRLEYYQKGGLVDRLGLRYRDVIVGINGVRISDLPMLVKHFRQLKDERSFSLDVVRNGEKGTISYEIR